MQTLKRQSKFTKLSERAIVLRYWSCDICLEFFLCLVTHDPPLKFVRSVHSEALKGEMGDPIILTEVFGEWIFSRVLSQLLPSTTLALYVLCTCSNSLDSRYGIVLSCKCTSSQHMAIGIWTAVKQSAFCKPLPEKCKGIAAAQRNPKHPEEASPATFKDLV